MTTVSNHEIFSTNRTTNIGFQSETFLSQWLTNCYSGDHQEAGTIPGRQPHISSIIADRTTTLYWWEAMGIVFSKVMLWSVVVWLATCWMKLWILFLPILSHCFFLHQNKPSNCSASPFDLMPNYTVRQIRRGSRNNLGIINHIFSKKNKKTTYVVTPH